MIIGELRSQSHIRKRNDAAVAFIIFATPLAIIDSRSSRSLLSQRGALVRLSILGEMA
jgi:hypothetical protein